MLDNLSNNSAFRIAAIVMLLLGVGMFIGGFFVPPVGVIDGSVITAFGEILAAIGLLMAWNCIELAIKKGVDATVTHRDTTIAVTGGDNANDNDNAK